MPLTPSVGTGQIITPTWGNDIRDRTVQRFASLAELNTWATAPDGCVAYITDDDSLLVREAGVWKWYVKSYPLATGNAAWITYAAPAAAGSSFSSVKIAGRGITLAVSIGVATPGTSAAGTFANMATAYRPTLRADAALACVHGAGAGSGRMSVQTNGAVDCTYAAGNNPQAATALYATVTYAVAALIAA